MNDILKSNLIEMDRIDFPIDLLVDELKLRNKPARIRELQLLVEEASLIAKPQAGYIQVMVDKVTKPTLCIDDTEFSSKILCRFLSPGDVVFPFLATCGRELDNWAKSKDDFLLRYWAEVLQEYASKTALDVMRQQIIKDNTLTHLSSLSPGSLEDFPIEQQIPLFHLLHGIKNDIGVELTDSLLMLPGKSISGICFKTDREFESCQLCRRENCYQRRADFCPHLLKSF